MSFSSEMNVLDPVPDRVTLQSGSVVIIESLKLRQFFRLMKIVTHGAGSSLLRMDLSPDDSADVFGTKLLSMVLLSIPDSEDETIDFLMSMVKPDGLIENRLLDKAAKERNDFLLDVLHKELMNPELEDTISILEVVVQRESADLQALARKVMSMFKVAQKTGQAPNLPSTPDQNSSEASAVPMTSYPAATDGPTTSSEVSLSGESVNA